MSNSLANPGFYTLFCAYNMGLGIMFSQFVMVCCKTVISFSVLG